jgi:hypothetical protein
MPDLNVDAPPLGRQHGWARSHPASMPSPWHTERITPVGSEPPPWVTKQVKRQPPPDPEPDPLVQNEPGATEPDEDDAAQPESETAPEPEPEPAAADPEDPAETPRSTTDEPQPDADASADEPSPTADHEAAPEQEPKTGSGRANGRAYRRVKPTDLGPYIGEVALLILGSPNEALSTQDQLRFGTNGSTSVEIAGTKAGTYYNHEHKRGGSVIQLLAFEHNRCSGCRMAPRPSWRRHRLGAAPQPLHRSDRRDIRLPRRGRHARLSGRSPQRSEGLPPARP